jgi:hypothetical protein
LIAFYRVTACQPRIKFARSEKPEASNFVRGNFPHPRQTLQRLRVHIAQQMSCLFIVQQRFKVEWCFVCLLFVLNQFMNPLFLIY